MVRLIFLFEHKRRSRRRKRFVHGIERGAATVLNPRHFPSAISAFSNFSPKWPASKDAPRARGHQFSQGAPSPLDGLDNNPRKERGPRPLTNWLGKCGPRWAQNLAQPSAFPDVQLRPPQRQSPQHNKSLDPHAALLGQICSQT